MMGNEINSSGGIIRKHSEMLGPYRYKDGDGEECKQFDGMTNVEMFTTVLLRSINPETGIWGDLTESAPKGCEFRYINGFFKTVHGLISNGVPYPQEYVVKAAKQIMACLMGDEPSTDNVCEIFNIWSTVTFLKECMKLEKDESVRESVLSEIDGILKKSAPAAVLNTYNKLKGYKKAEGGDSGQCIFLIDRPDYTGTDTTFVFEGKFRISAMADGAIKDGMYMFDVTLCNADGKRVYRNYFGGGKVTVNGSNGDVAGSAFNTGEWFTLRVEYTVVGSTAEDASWNVKIFVNDTLAVSSDAPTTESVFANSLGIDKVGIIVSREFVGHLDIDDIKMYQKAA